jgi:general secretion pathway protein G
MQSDLARNRARVRRDGGYTLTEMLVVMAVIGLIAAVLTPGLIGQLGRARAKTAQMQLDTIAAGVEMFRADVGRYPSDGEGIGALLTPPSALEGWTGPYLRDAKVLQDPWGNPVAYKTEGSGRGFTVTSFGADGQAAGMGLDRDLTAPNR